MLWEADSDGLYCWDYDRGRPTSQPKMEACELDGFPGVDPLFNATLDEWSFSTGNSNPNLDPNPDPNPNLNPNPNQGRTARRSSPTSRGYRFLRA